MSNSRQLASIALRNIYRQGAYTDIALDRVLKKANLNAVDRGLVTELVYGIVRRQRSLDALIDRLATKPAARQPPELRIVLHIGLYQLRYLTQVPESAAVNTSVELAKENGLKKLAGVVNGLLRQYARLAAENTDPLVLPQDLVRRLGVLYSFPDWIIEKWLEQFTLEETEQLCIWFDRSPHLDLRVNPLKTTLEEVEAALSDSGVAVSRLSQLPQALRLTGNKRSIRDLPGYREGWWTVQDSSAQLVTHLLDPQPEETIVDACAAPGGKTTHIAELMGDRGTIWGCDRDLKRLRKLEANSQRLQLKSIQLCGGDSRNFAQFHQSADRVLLDAPCSGLGTLHKRPDIRWRQTPEKIQELGQLQRELLDRASEWVKPGGTLVYATCTLNQWENEAVIEEFLNSHCDWQLQTLSNPIANEFSTSQGWLKVLPHQHDMDGFFMAKLVKGRN